MLKQAFEKVLDDPRIAEVVISDDASDDETVRWIKNNIHHPKVKVFWHSENVGMSRNKAESIRLASNDWCILLDSDNIIDSSYIDAIFQCVWNPEVILCPNFDRPNFDFTEFTSLKFDRKTVKRYIKKGRFEILLNTCNYFVHRDQYLEVYQYNPAMKGTDTIWFNYNWLKRGKSFYVVPGMQYEHRVHDGSGFMADMDYNMKKAKELKRMIERLCTTCARRRRLNE
jgi:glycosyltransferase involved in cell wall biosynthesis